MTTKTIKALEARNKELESIVISLNENISTMKQDAENLSLSENELVRIPAGSFLMGALRNDDSADYDKTPLLFCSKNTNLRGFELHLLIDEITS